MKQKKTGSLFTRGIFSSNPVLVLYLGLCPALAVTSTVKMALLLGGITVLVFLCASTLTAMLRRITPDNAQIPSYIVVSAALLSIVCLVLQSYAPAMIQGLGIYLPLVAVNSVILCRMKDYSSKHSVGRSLLDSLGMGIGFALALFLLGSVREVLGAGTWFAIPLTKHWLEPMLLFALPAGGLLVLAFLTAGAQHMIARKKGSDEQ